VIGRRFLEHVGSACRAPTSPNAIKPNHLLGDTSMRRTSLAALIPMVTWFAAACSDASAPTATSPRTVDAANLAKNSTVPPVIDGVLSPNEWDGAATMSFRVMLPSTEGAVPAKAYITHDKQYLYLAVTFDRTSPFHDADFLGFEFDNDNDGITDDGDDIVLTSSGIPVNTQSLAGDFYRFNNGAYNQSDLAGGGAINAITAWGVMGTTGVFEIRKELDSSDNAHDFSIDPSLGAVTVGVRAQVSLEANPVGSGVLLDTSYPSQTTFCQLTIAKKATSLTCP
jgi:hypothetical protein